MSTFTAEQDSLFADYTRTTNRWGRLTLFLGFLIATSIPFIVLATTDIDVTFGQTFLIGNIANKLVPSAIVAQNALGTKPGTRKAAYAATAAISGAAVVHVTSLVLLVGVLGTWIVSITPESVTDVARVYILPAILGGVMVQLIATLKQVKATLIAVAVALVVVFLIVPNTPKIVSGFAVAIAVVLTVLISWYTRDRSAGTDGADEPDVEDSLIN